MTGGHWRHHPDYRPGRFGPDRNRPDGPTREANDFAAAGTLLAPGGATVGLAHITFTAAAGTPSQVVPVSLISAQAGTSLSDDAGNPLPFTIINGQITVGTVPEPSSVIMLGTAIVLGLAYHRPRRA